MLVKYFFIFDEKYLLFCDTAVFLSNIDIRIMTKKYRGSRVYRCSPSDHTI